MKKNLKDKAILYLVHDYDNFQKDPIEEAAKYFKKVYVLVRYKPLSWFAKYLPIKALRKYADSYVINLTNLPSNVEVIRSPVWYLPFGIFYKWAGYLHYKSVESTIKKYNIEFDIIHAHFLWSAGYVGMRLKEKYNVPFVVTGHGFDVYQLPFSSRFWRGIIIKILNSADATITCSDNNVRYLKKLERREDKIFVINNGFDKGKFFIQDKSLVRKRLEIDRNRKICLSVGNLEKVKNHEDLILAMKRVIERNKDTDCYIIGDGSQHRNLEKLIEENSLTERVFLLGHKEHSEIGDWINASDIFVLPSLREGAPVVLLEALSCGRPVVATRVGNVADVLISDDYGYIVEPNDVEELSKKIDLAVCKKWDEQKIKKSVSDFSWEKVVKEIIKVYGLVIIKQKNS
jgi:glycosyltransferase involved in cell wall biosynthesis